MRDNKYNKEFLFDRERLEEAIGEYPDTVAALARETGIHKSTIYRYLKGTLKPSIQALEYLASALQVSVGWIRGYDVPKYVALNVEYDNDKNLKISQPAYDSNSHPLTMTDLKILTACAKLPAAKKMEILKLVNDLQRLSLYDRGIDYSALQKAQNEVNSEKIKKRRSKKSETAKE